MAMPSKKQVVAAYDLELSSLIQFSALDSPLEELASEMKNFKLDLLDDLDRIFNQSTTTSTPQPKSNTNWTSQNQ